MGRGDDEERDEVRGELKGLLGAPQERGGCFLEAGGKRGGGWWVCWEGVGERGGGGMCVGVR